MSDFCSTAQSVKMKKNKKKRGKPLLFPICCPPSLPPFLSFSSPSLGVYPIPHADCCKTNSLILGDPGRLLSEQLLLLHPSVTNKTHTYSTFDSELQFNLNEPKLLSPPPIPPILIRFNNVRGGEQNLEEINLLDKKTMGHTLHTRTHAMHGQITAGYLRSFFLHFCNIIYYQNHNQQRYKAEQQRAEYKRHGRGRGARGPSFHQTTVFH